MTALQDIRNLYNVDGPWPGEALQADVNISTESLESACAALMAMPLLNISPSALARSERDPKIRKAWNQRKAKAVLATARTLMDKGDTESALALFDLPQPHIDGAYLMTWARAAERVNAKGVMQHALQMASETLDQGQTDDPRLAPLVQRMQAQYGMSRKADYFAQRWLPISDRGLRHDLTRLEDLPEPKLDETLLRWVYSQRNDPDLSYRDFRRRAIWGHNASQFIRDYHGALAGKEGLDMPPQTLKALRAEARSLCAPIDLTPITDLIAKGQSVVVTTAHVGFLNEISRQFHNKKDLPLIQIGANSVKGDKSDDSFFLARGNVQSAFLKLIKKVRKEPHVIFVAADGPYGSDMKTLDFLGLPIALAQGAPTLAYHAKAQTVYLGSRWTGDGVAPYLRTGPVPDESTDREDWPDIWFRFYLDCLREVVQGPPEDMRLYSGIWLLLRNALRSGSPRAQRTPS